MNLFSIEFLILLFVLLALYYCVPKKMQWICLLLASCIFYLFSDVKNAIFIGITSVTTWYASLVMMKLSEQFKKEKKQEGITKESRKQLKKNMISKKRIVLVITLFINFGILAYLKYWQVIYANISKVIHMKQENSALGLLLPLGISFYTFQSIGYLIDQYKETYEPEKNYFRYLLFVSFFPQMIQGPINRFNEMREQFFTEHYWEWEETKRALFLILLGVMKKFSIANLLADAVSAILDAPTVDMPGSVIVMGILMYSAQQYADFSGGIDMVLGIAQLFGIYMAPNFRQPYFAVSLADFWRRWHISLGSWMRDYVFYPFALTKKMQKLGKWGINHLGKQVGRVLPACLGNILVFFIVGIWHGAELHFILWGLYNGIVIAVSELMSPIFADWKTKLNIKESSKGYYIFCVLRTFLIVNIGWYFDRIIKLSDCILCFKNTFVNFKISEFAITTSELLSGILTKKEIIFILLAVMLVFIHSYLTEKKKDVFELLSRSPLVVRWGIYYVMLILIQFSMSCSMKTEAFMYAVF